MVKLQIVKSAGGALKQGCRCTVSCCVDNDNGRCSVRSTGAKVCSSPCALFVQITTNCTSRCDTCNCRVG